VKYIKTFKSDDFRLITNYFNLTIDDFSVIGMQKKALSTKYAAEGPFYRNCNKVLTTYKVDYARTVLEIRYTNKEKGENIKTIESAIKEFISMYGK
jgi:hypothetical protein